jgi:2-polyprenyl-3-methyl-5-hydroxy-6-metoxy-1,4-benzoquinol methylase
MEIEKKSIDSEIRKLNFENIYKKGGWNHNIYNIPRSGPGSSLNYTNEIRTFLNNFISENFINTVCDLGCGDLNWIKHTKAFNVDYTGIDIVENLIIEHKINHPTKKFYTKDIISESVTEENEIFDLIIIRDVIFHIKIKDIFSLFENIKNKFKYILITSCNNSINEDNHDPNCHFSKVNLEIEPFNKTKGKIVADESHSDRKILLFKHNDFYDN